jgi:hypothetical protein
MTPCDLPADIYKQVLPDGTVSYSNQPHPNAEKIDPPLPQVIPAAKPLSEALQGRTPPSAASSYTRLSIAEPADDQVVWSNERNISVAVVIEPLLQVHEGHRLVILLDGTPVTASGHEMRLTLNDVDRGTHTLTAEVYDAQGQVLILSAPVTFHLKQHSVLPPPSPAAP